MIRYLFLVLFLSSIGHGRTILGCAADLVIHAPAFAVEDAYSRSYHAQHFWELHPRFGVIRVGDGRLVLLARNQELLFQLIGDLQRYSGNYSEVSYLSVQGIAGTGVDITPIVTPLMRDLHETYAGLERNCRNLTLVERGIAFSTHCTHEREFTAWMKSPLATPVRSAAELAPGDVIAFRQGNGQLFREVHAVIYISPRIVFQKGDYYSSVPYRIVDLYESYNYYRGDVTHVDGFKVMSLPDYVARFGRDDQALREMVDAVRQYELTLVRQPDWDYFARQASLTRLRERLAEGVRTGRHPGVWEALAGRLHSLERNLRIEY